MLAVLGQQMASVQMVQGVMLLMGASAALTVHATSFAAIAMAAAASLPKTKEMQLYHFNVFVQ